MERKEFLSILGVGAAAIACGRCFTGCKKNDSVTNPPTNVDFTLDLTNPAYAALKTNGGFIYNSGVIVARTASGSYIAVSSTCTHAGGTVQFDVNNNLFHCPVHGSNFAVDGSVLNGPAGSPLTKYNTSLSGNSLRVYS
jgi:cytochrome b6-f complex iron-sulfur subunit